MSAFSKLNPSGLSRSNTSMLATLQVRDYQVEDADTVQILLSNGQTSSLRLAGIDAPETEHGDEYASNKVFQNQPYGQEATRKLEELLSNQSTITAMFATNGDSTYGRTPALLFGDNGENLNLALVRQGAAASLPYGAASERIFDTAAFNRAQEAAYEEERGMWSDDGWRAAKAIQDTSKRKITHNTFTDLEKLFNNFRAASIVQRLRNPEAEFAEMTAAGGKTDANIIEGLRHGWGQENRQDNLGDFGSGYKIDRVINTVKSSTKTKRRLMAGLRFANTHTRDMMDGNWNKHHIG